MRVLTGRTQRTGPVVARLIEPEQLVPGERINVEALLTHIEESPRAPGGLLRHDMRPSEHLPHGRAPRR